MYIYMREKMFTLILDMWLWLALTSSDMERVFKWKCKNRIEKKPPNLMKNKKNTRDSPSPEYIGYNNVRIICGTLSWPSCWFAYFIWFVETNCISPKTVWTHSHKTMLKCNVALHIYLLCAYIWCFWSFFSALSLNIATTFPVWFVFHISKPCKIQCSVFLWIDIHFALFRKAHDTLLNKLNLIRGSVMLIL